MDLRIKKSLYLLFAFQGKSTIDFLRKHNHLIKPPPASFKKLVSKMHLSFLKNRSLNLQPVDALWHAFLKKTSYEEACAVAFTTAGYSVKDLSWILKLPPDVLGFRLKRGLVTLGGEVLRGQKSSSLIFSEEKQLQAAQEYCKKLKTTLSLPVDLKELVLKTKTSFLWILILGVLGAILVAWLLKKVLHSDQYIILYQTPL